MSRNYFLSIMFFIGTFLLTFVLLSEQEDDGEIVIIYRRVGKKIELIKYKKVIQTLKLMLILTVLNLKGCAPKKYPAFAEKNTNCIIGSAEFRGWDKIGYPFKYQ